MMHSTCCCLQSKKTSCSLVSKWKDFNSLDLQMLLVNMETPVQLQHWFCSEDFETLGFCGS